MRNGQVMRNGMSRTRFLAVVLGACLLGTGCTALPQIGMPDLSAFMPPSKEAKKDPRMVQSLGKCTVEFQDADGTPKGSSEWDVGEETIVSEILRRSGTFRRYNRVMVDLHRKLPNGQRHRMEITVDKVKQRPEPHEDYHVRPGDKLIVTHDPRNILDDMLNQASGGLIGRGAPRR